MIRYVTGRAVILRGKKDFKQVLFKEGTVSILLTVFFYQVYGDYYNIVEREFRRIMLNMSMTYFQKDNSSSKIMTTVYVSMNIPHSQGLHDVTFIHFLQCFVCSLSNSSELIVFGTDILQSNYEQHLTFTSFSVLLDSIGETVRHKR